MVVFSNGRPLPPEILENIAYELAASTPLGNPYQILPLLLTNKAIHSALSMDSGTLLYSRICRHKLDIAAVTRRAFTPRIRDLNGHLMQFCTLLKFLRGGNIHHEDVDDQLLNAYVAMLHNDGKNRAQLEHAGIVDFLERFVRARLSEGRESHNNWPADSVRNASALWLMWMFTTRERLLQETPEQREEIVSLVFPFLVCPHRYPSAIVPPNHFTLPLGTINPVQKEVFTLETAHGYYPLYHTNKGSSMLWYFRSSTSFLEPLIAPVASLLFWSRRELNGGFGVPEVLPPTRNPPDRPGLTQEDFREVNSFKVAKLPPEVRWDWERGVPICRADDGTISDWRESDSERWDIDWWRARLCDSLFHKQPKFRLGAVYVRGMLTGLWQGVQFSQAHNIFNLILSQPQCPTNLSEPTTSYSGRPLYLRLKEHGYVRTPAPTSHLVEPSAVPQAPSGHMPITVTNTSGSHEAVVPIDISLGNAWFPGPIGSVKWVENCEPLDPGILQDQFQAAPAAAKEPMRTTKLLISDRSPLQPNNTSFISEVGGPVDAGLATTHSGKTYIYETYDRAKESVHKRMVEAKEKLEYCVPGAGASSSASPSSSKTPQRHPGCFRCAERDGFLKNRKQKDTAKRMSDQELDKLFSSVGMEKRRSYLPDTGDEDNMDVFDLALDDDTGEGDESGGEGEDDLSIRTPEIPAPQLVSDTSSPPSPSSIDSSHNSDVEENEEEHDLDFDHEQGYPGVRDSSGRVHVEPVRRSHDRYRVEKCDDGMEDVVVTGDMDERHRLAWGPSVYYGRVRPWDGMIAILRIAQDRNATPSSHMIYYGYIYGGDTFVGNWRYAALDPMTPSFECAFVMSKRKD